jgi:hypothetical protein
MTRIEIFERIIEKHDEYVQCLPHIQLRGASDIGKETLPMLEEAAKNFIGKDFKNYILEFYPNTKIESDRFLTTVIRFLDNN